MFVNNERADGRMRALDQINRRMGSHNLRYGALGLKRRARRQCLRQQHSPRCTTRWDELFMLCLPPAQS